MDKIRIGISTCLLGERVRYDGQHKLDRFLTGTLGKYVDYVPVCPEVECGLPVPREAMRLVGSTENPRLMTQRTGIDLTERMMTWARRRVVELEKENLRGYIFKSKSPSSGMERVKVYNGRGGLSGRAPGMFAKEFMAHFPLLPVEDEGRLHDPDLRDNFITRIFALQRYRESVAATPSVGALMGFHSSHKLLLMSHSQERLREMGRAIAGLKRRDVARFVSRYEQLLLETLKLRATARKHANVLHHMLGYFKPNLDSAEKQEALDLVEQYRQGLLPLVVPLTLFKHYVTKYGVDYLAQQVYLDPHPLELQLRYHA